MAFQPGSIVTSIIVTFVVAKIREASHECTNKKYIRGKNCLSQRL
jgi:2-phospho-L-lactate transferase/gluconeogenesis factor (CofD/UPF0052 family)